MNATAEAMVKPVFDVEAVRRDFPILTRKVHGKPLVFLDGAASAQKPRQVIDAIKYVYENEYANVHRGIHWMSERATDRMEASRETVRQFLNAGSTSEIVFTRNTTEAINLVSASWGRNFLKAGDEIIITEMEHHSNIIPWQFLRDEKGVVIRVAPVTDDGEFRLDEFASLLNERTKLVAVTHISNVLGTVVPLKEVVRMAHDAGAKVLVDGAQAVMHTTVDVRDLDCDFYAFSGHKLYGPSGAGVLYGKEALLDEMPPYMGGGMMISSVSFETSEWAGLPHKFEAGTPAIAEAIGLGAAIDYVTELGLDAVAAHEQDVLHYATQRLASIEGLKFIGTAPGKASVLSFTMDCAHPHDIGTLVDRAGIAIRVGHHCAQPLMDRLGVVATGRASFGVYNTRAEADALASALQGVREFFG
jgi:cysteine desulfurase/selenocysteine lyase